MRIVVLTLLILSTLIASAAEYAAPPLPVKPKHFAMDRIDWSLFAADVAARSLDAYSTQRALRCACNREANVTWITAYPAASWAYSESIPVANLLAAHYLERHQHNRLAKLLPVIDISYDTPATVSNLMRPIPGKHGSVRYGK